MTRKSKKQVLSLAIHPGDALREELKERGISQKDLAKQMDYSPTQLNEVIKGKRSMNSDLAFKLEQALGIPHSVWMNLQSHYERQTQAAPP